MAIIAGQCVLAGTLPPLGTGRFCWSTALLPACPCWRQPVHLDLGEDARVLLTGVTYTISVPITYSLILYQSILCQYLHQTAGVNGVVNILLKLF